MSDDSHWIERAQSAEARSKTYGDQVARLKDECRDVKEALCAKKLSNGVIQIDYEKLVVKLGIEGWLELRAIGDAQHAVSGAAGEKPRVRMKASAAAAEA